MGKTLIWNKKGNVDERTDLWTKDGVTYEEVYVKGYTKWEDTERCGWQPGMKSVLTAYILARNTEHFTPPTRCIMAMTRLH